MRSKRAIDLLTERPERPAPVAAPAPIATAQSILAAFREHQTSLRPAWQIAPNQWVSVAVCSCGWSSSGFTVQRDAAICAALHRAWKATH